jgi:FtsH-binding integral membrane protein
MNLLRIYLWRDLMHLIVKCDWVTKLGAFPCKNMTFQWNLFDNTLACLMTLNPTLIILLVAIEIISWILSFVEQIFLESRIVSVVHQRRVAYLILYALKIFLRLFQCISFVWWDCLRLSKILFFAVWGFVVSLNRYDFEKVLSIR